MSKILPTYFLSHGGGPWPWVPEMNQAFTRTAAWLKSLPSQFPETPRALLSISGHWEEKSFTVSTAAKPPMIYDYFGFPDHTYKIQYPAPGNPAVAERVSELLIAAGLPQAQDAGHGLDHGTFVPMALMFPKADMPVVSLSLNANYDPAMHLALGHALAPLRKEGVLIVGSGLSYHNLRAFGSAGADAISKNFNRWLNDALADPANREKKLLEWEKAPDARLAHPQEDHLLPGFVAAGAAAREPGKLEFTDHVFGVEMNSYRFG
jgi:aromatic ring-opening dioxygenase catalytic subunit (LigB family)